MNLADSQLVITVAKVKSSSAISSEESPPQDLTSSEAFIATRTGWPTCFECGWHQFVAHESGLGSKLPVQRLVEPEREQLLRQEREQQRGPELEPLREQRLAFRRDHSWLRRRGHSQRRRQDQHHRWGCCHSLQLHRAGYRHRQLRNHTGTDPFPQPYEPSCRSHPEHTSELEQLSRYSSSDFA